MRRTTVTLDSDVERLLERLMRERSVSFKTALNEAVRLGAGASRRERGTPFRQKTYRMGLRPEYRWDKALAMAESMEDEELLRKMELRK